MENDNRKLRLIYHFTDINVYEINPDQSLLKLKTTWTTHSLKTKNSKI